VTADAGDIMIRFSCEKCGQKFKVPENRAGKKGTCPKCKNVIIVPEIGVANQLPAQDPPLEQAQVPEESPYDPVLLDVPQKPETAAGPADQYDDSDMALQDQHTLLLGYPKPEPEPAPERKLPWPIDILLYPVSKPCLITLAIVVIIPFLLNIFAIMVGPFWMIVFFPGLVVRIIIGLYFYWYVAESVRDSAAGGLRGPETMGNAPGLGDMLWQMLQIVGCFAVCFVPLLIYYVRTERIDMVYWSLLGYAAVFFPMGLLAVVMFDSFSGLNPILIVGSILSTFFQYCAMVALLFGVVFLFHKAASVVAESLLLSAVLYLARMYLALVAAHILGRFFFRYQEKLNWEV